MKLGDEEKFVVERCGEVARCAGWEAPKVGHVVGMVVKRFQVGGRTALRSEMPSAPLKKGIPFVGLLVLRGSRKASSAQTLAYRGLTTGRERICLMFFHVFPATLQWIMVLGVVLERHPTNMP